MTNKSREAEMDCKSLYIKLILLVLELENIKKPQAF